MIWIKEPAGCEEHLIVALLAERHAALFGRQWVSALLREAVPFSNGGTHLRWQAGGGYELLSPVEILSNRSSRMFDMGSSLSGLRL
jgi:hypothetical protein